MSKKQTIEIAIEVIEIAIEVYEEIKQFQEHFIQKVEPKPVDQMTGNIYFGSGYLTVRVGELSDRTKEIIKQLVLGEMESSLIGTNKHLEEMKLELSKL